MTHSPTSPAAGLGSSNQIRAAAPALAEHTRDRLFGTVWNRPGLNKRDRSLISVAALIARGQSAALSRYGAEALDNGVTPAELSETILHLAYYAGWGNAIAATAPIAAIYADRGIDEASLLAGEPNERLSLDEEAEAKRKQTVGDKFGGVAPGLVDYTTDYLFRDLWLRPALAPRDRSLVTVAALIAAGQSEQVTFHLGKAMDNGLTREQAAEVVTHLAFYAGWPNAMSALNVFKDVFAERRG